MYDYTNMDGYTLHVNGIYKQMDIMKLGVKYMLVRLIYMLTKHQ